MPSSESEQSCAQKKRIITSKNKLSCKKERRSSAVIIGCGKRDMTVFIFRRLLSDLTLVELTNIFLSDSDLSRCPELSFMTAGQDRTFQLSRSSLILLIFIQTRRKIVGVFQGTMGFSECFFCFQFVFSSLSPFLRHHAKLRDIVNRDQAPASVLPRHSRLAGRAAYLCGYSFP